MDHFASKSNLKASVLAAHSRGINLMIVWSRVKSVTTLGNT